MTDNIRLSSQEQEDLRKKAVEINTLLIKKGMQPMRDSTLVHRILEKAIKNARLSESGDIIIDPR